MQKLTSIDSFIDKMIEMLPTDLLTYFLTEYVYKQRNLQIIRQQKAYRITLNKELFDIFNVYYHDNNFKLYRNRSNQYVLHNNLDIKNKQIFICTPNNEIIPANDSNELVLFNNQEPQNRRIKVYIVYM